MASVIFFASIREDLGTDRVSLDIEEGMRVSELIDALAASNGPEWGEILKAGNIKVAVNQELVSADVALAPQDEVAFFPPVTGG